jgi:hypothetical protein
MCTPVTPAVPYLLLGLQDVQWAVGNSRGARKLARTPHVNQKKKKKFIALVNDQMIFFYLLFIMERFDLELINFSQRLSYSSRRKKEW